MPFEVVCRLGVDYKIKSAKGKVTVVHHDRLKRGYVPSNNTGNIVCPAREVGDNQVVIDPVDTNIQPNCENAPHVPRVRPRNLRQDVHPPDRYGFAA